MKRRRGICTFFTILLSLQFVVPPPALAASSPQIARFLCERGVSYFRQNLFDKALKEFEMPVTNQAITQRVCYQSTIRDGAAFYSGKDAKKAKKEIDNLTLELIDFKA